MVMRSVHYEQAFEHYLRVNAVPYVGVDEARRALVDAPRSGDQSPARGPVPLKSFDFVIYDPRGNVLLDVKGRKCDGNGRRRGRLQTWVTRSDVESLCIWRDLFGEGFAACFAFVYWCPVQPPDGLFEEVFEFRGRWYVMRLVDLDDYRRCMRPRSARWQTISVRSADFERIARPVGWHRPAGALDQAQVG